MIEEVLIRTRGSTNAHDHCGYHTH